MLIAIMLPTSVRNAALVRIIASVRCVTPSVFFVMSERRRGSHEPSSPDKREILSNQPSSRNFSASSAAMHPEPADVTACR
jgi:hypothetical protein